METRLLQSFLQVAELGSVSRAAERLHITQPALSRQIQQLEHDLGAPVFRRTGRGVRLTPAGEELEARARPLVAQLDRLAEEVLSSADEVRGTVRLALPPSAGTAKAADLLQAYRARYPRVAVRVAFALTGSIESGLLRGEIDVGVLFGNPESRVLTSQPLWTESVCLVSPPSFVPPSRPLPFSAASTLPLLLPAPRHGLRIHVDRAGAAAGVEVNVIAEVDSLQLLLELVRRGEGHTMLPARVALDAGEPSLRVTSLVDPELVRTTSVTWTADRPMSRASAAMIEMLHEFYDA